MRPLVLMYLGARGNKMDIAYISALAALAGSAIGGLTSIFSSWLGQSVQLKAQLFLHDKDRRQELYHDFINEASQLYIDAVTHDKPDLSKAVTLYALISRMRILSSPKVVEEADKLAQLIVNSYPEPNKTFSELHDMMKEHALDPLRGFSEACRKELIRL
jgi:hypothetical protein